MISPAQLASMRRKPPVTQAYDAEHTDDGTTVTSLRYAMGPLVPDKPLICYWAMVSASSELDEEDIEIHSFDADGMTKEGIHKKVVFLAMESLIKNNHQEFNLHVYQEYLMQQIRKVQNVIPFVSIMHNNKTGIHHSKRLIEHLGNFVSPLLSEADKQMNDKVSYQRFLYVDASMAANGGGEVGYGFVIKDIVFSPDGEEKYWRLGFSSAMTKVQKGEGSTGAELQAIFRAIRSQRVIKKKIRDGERSLTIVSDSKYGIDILNALRHGTTPPTDIKINDLSLATAERIIAKLADIKDVQFQWVKGHGDDLLNDAADRLALSERRNERCDIPQETREFVKNNIIAHTLERLEAQGIKAVHDEG